MFHFLNSFIFNLCTKLLKTANGESLDRARDFRNIDQKHKCWQTTFYHRHITIYVYVFTTEKNVR